MKKIKIEEKTYFFPEYKAIVIYKNDENNEDIDVINKIDYLYHKNKIIH